MSVRGKKILLEPHGQFVESLEIYAATIKVNTQTSWNYLHNWEKNII